LNHKDGRRSTPVFIALLLLRDLLACHRAPLFAIAEADVTIATSNNKARRSQADHHHDHGGQHHEIM